MRSPEAPGGPDPPDLADLLEAGLELPAAERRGVLETCCADPERVERALRLLAAEDRLGGFLDEPAGTRLAGVGNDLAETPEPPEAPAIPGFEPIRPLGAGGMGRVWLARQTDPIERTVAVKVIRPDLLGRLSGHEDEAVRRFLAERRALARLNHRSIAQLYDARTTAAGLPCVVMEYVDGLPITRYCDRERLPVAARLRLFQELCHGVVHAHRRQLLHRDLKPSNVLVTAGTDGGRPEVKIIDFGIAHALDPLEEHEPDAPAPGRLGPLLVGTPAYMSPEALDPARAAAGDLDTRTDVYSLGVLLYELLAGTRPCAISSESAARRLGRIEAGDPELPSARLAGLAADERRAVAEARDTTPTRLAWKLRGDLDAIVLRAIAADRDERYGSAEELAQDVDCALHGRPIGARPVGVVARIGKLARRHRAAAAMLLLALGASAAGAVATSTSLVRARRAERVARDEVTAANQVLDFLVGLFESGRPEETMGRAVPAAEVVARGAERIEEEDLPPLQRARLLHTLADVQLRLGEYRSAIGLATEALALREERLPADDPAIFESLDLLGTALRHAGDLDRAAPYVERLLALAERGGDPERLADALNTLGNLRWREGLLEDAEAIHRRALALREARYDEARGAGDAAVEEDSVDDLAGSLNNVGVLLWAEDRPEEAMPYLRRSLKLLESRLGDRHPRVAGNLNNLGIVAAALGRYEEGAALQGRALAIHEEVLGPDHPATAATLANLGVDLAALGRNSEAEEVFRRALAIRRDSLGEDHTETLAVLTNLANVLRKEGRYDEAEGLYRQALEVRLRARPLDREKVSFLDERLATLAERRGASGEAAALRARGREAASAPP